KGNFLGVTYPMVKDLGLGFFAVQQSEGYWEIFQIKDGALVGFNTPYTLDEVGIFTEDGVCSFRYGGYAGVIDKNGKVLIEPNRFLSIGEFHDGLAVANDNNTKGYITLKGDWVYSENFTDIYAAKFLYAFRNGFAVFEKEKYKYTYMDKTGKLPFSKTWTSCNDFTKEGFARVAIPDKQSYYKYGVINIKGEYVLKPVYRDIQLYENNLVVFQDSSGRGLMNIATQKVIIPPTDVDEITIVGERVRLKKTGERWGYINERGEFVIQPQFEYAGDFEKGVASVLKNGYNYFINKKGEKVARKNESSHDLFIDTDGMKDVLKSYTTLQPVISTSYDRIIESQSVSGLFFVNLGGVRQEMIFVS
ncbi:MAG: WG repeat-containing protein, partial [Flammeovirgaceae bacterium]|nr:WG repeat-containing protein [Flammeovirgaceae bacterium]